VTAIIRGVAILNRASLEPLARELMDLRDKGTLELFSTGAISCRSDDSVQAETVRRDLSVFYGCVLAVSSCSPERAPRRCGRGDNYRRVCNPYWR
jgi:hypothetical protein